MTSDSICCHLVTLFFKWSNKVEHVGCCWLKRGILGWRWLDKFGILVIFVFLLHKFCFSVAQTSIGQEPWTQTAAALWGRSHQRKKQLFLFRTVLTVSFCWIVHTVHVHCHGFSWNLKDARKRSQGRVQRGSLMAFHSLTEDVHNRWKHFGLDSQAHAAHWMVVLFWVCLAN